jgi:hypothetical protein
MKIFTVLAAALLVSSLGLSKAFAGEKKMHKTTEVKKEMTHETEGADDMGEAADEGTDDMGAMDHEEETTTKTTKKVAKKAAPKHMNKKTK